MTLEEFYRNQYANPDIWGTEGAYFSGQFNRGGDGAEDIDPMGTIGVNLNGQQYQRTGTADNSRFDQFGGGVIYDPTYGWVVPSSVASAYGDSRDNSMNYFLAASGMLAAPYAASTGLFGAAGTMGAEGGVFGPGGELVPSTYGGVGGAGAGSVDAPWGVNARPDIGAMQAIDGSAQTIYDAAANAGIGGYDAALTSGVAAGGSAGSTLASGNIVNGGFDLGDIFKTGSLANTLLGKVAPAALGAYGASQQADAYRDMQNQYFGLGAPYRDLLQKSYQPGFSLQNEPGFKDAMDTSFNTFMRAASAGNASGVSSGNPFDNPGAIMESQKYLMGNLGLPYLQNYRSGLSQSGQLGLGPAAQFGGNAIQSQGGVYDAVGYGLGEIFNPKKDYGIVIMDGVNNGRYKMGSI